MSDESPTDPRVTAAREFCTLASEFWHKQNERENDDLAFQVPDLQWTDAAKKLFDGGMVDGLWSPPRPRLSISKIDQPIKLILNQERAAHLGVEIHPLSENANNDTAEALQDIYRDIERNSFADLARTWSYERAVKAGIGKYRVLTEYADEDTEGPGLHDQKIVIKRIKDQRCVLLDPYAQEPDWSDARRALIYEMVPFDRYKDDFPESNLASFSAMDFDGVEDDIETTWWSGTEEAGRAVRVAEFFYIETVKEAKTFGGKSRVIQKRVVHWCKVNGVEVLDEAIIPGKYIPIIVELGEELQPFDSEPIRVFGVIHRAKDPQRLLNIETSSAVNKDALASKVHWLLAEGQEEGHEVEFEMSTTRNLSMIRYKPTTLNGQLVAPPQQMLSSPDLSSSLLLIAQANDAIEATTATPSPSLGKHDPRAVSGRAKLADREQSEASNSNFLDNHARALRHEARVVLGMIPAVYDRPGRIVRTVDAEENEQALMLNAPFVMDPKTKRPMPAPEQGAMPEGGKTPKVRHINLKEGVYGTSVSIGKSKRSRLEAGSDALGAIIQADPAMLPILGPTWLNFQDFPGHKEAADLLKKMQPAQLQQGENGEPSPEQQEAKLQQQGQMIEAAKQQIDQLTQALETKQVEQQGKVAAAQASEAGKAQIEQMKQAMEIQRLQMQGQIDAMLARLDGAIKLKLQDDQQAHEVAMAAAQAGNAESERRESVRHEVGMAAAGARDADQKAERGHAQSLEAGDRSHQQARELSEPEAE